MRLNNDECEDELFYSEQISFYIRDEKFGSVASNLSSRPIFPFGLDLFGRPKYLCTHLTRSIDRLGCRRSAKSLLE